MAGATAERSENDRKKAKNVRETRFFRDRQTDRDIHSTWNSGTKKWETWEPTYSKESVARRALCERELLPYLTTYHAPSFPIPFSDHHIELIRLTQTSILEGGLQVIVAMPRGSGKTTILTYAVMWAALFGHSRYSLLVAADDPKARKLLKKMRVELESNKLLLEDFPEVVHPIVSLDRSPTRAHYQMYAGVPTYLEFGSDRIVLPTLPQSVERGNAGCVISVGGIESAIRGANYSDPRTGETIRPSLVLADDPQTRRSAKSTVSNDEREQILCSDISMMKGPNSSMSTLVAATVIYPNDAVDRLLDPARHPEWSRIRVKMLAAMPTNKELWSKYAELRRLSLIEGRHGIDATEFYKANQLAMDEGAKPYWPERFSTPFVSAIESAMAFFFDNPEGFASEMQNEPLDPHAPEDPSLVILEEDVISAIGGTPRERFPSRTHSLVAMIDVSEKCLWWMVCGVSERFEVDIGAYGIWPTQNLGYVTLATLQQTLKAHYGMESRDAIRQGVQDLMSIIMEVRWENTAGEALRIEHAFVDSKWGPMSRVVKEAIWESQWSGIWVPSEGHGIGASSRALNDTTKARQPGEIRGQHWRKTREKEGYRCIYDTNHWKSFAASQVKDGKVAVHAGSVRSHQMLIEQLSSEYPVRVESKERVVDEWKQRNLKPDNHFFDCFVGCCVSASILGITLHGQVKGEGGEQKPITLSSMVRGRGRGR